MRLDFYLRFRTQFGQTLAVTGNVPALGNNEVSKVLPLQFLNGEVWFASIEIDANECNTLHYRYLLVDENGEIKKEAEKGRSVDIKKAKEDLVLLDAWNDESFVENAFLTSPFKGLYFKAQLKGKPQTTANYTHEFRVKAPVLQAHEAVCILGYGPLLKNWSTQEPTLLEKHGDWWTAYLDLSGTTFPIVYKYGVYDVQKNVFIRFEEGDNRVLHNDASSSKKTIIHDSFVRLPITSWKGSGVAIPVFSLRSNNSFGVGEFTDIKLLVDWAKQCGIKLIQLLPINDTSATFTWKDSYPYAAISAFALHPVYINLSKVAGKKSAGLVKALTKKQKQLNALAEVDYDAVIHIKMSMLKELFDDAGMSFMEEKEYAGFFEDNKAWLVPYAAFCYLRDKWGTAQFERWKSHSAFNKADIDKLTSHKSKTFKHIAFFYFVQYHLHLQLKEAATYAHKKGIALKGDIPIGIYRYGADAWTSPELYNMNMQAGAPPDDFAVKGQNWGFPTYNWKKMEEDQFEWWRMRFHQMSNYFNAFRIDHILGFFRIWSIPLHAVEGIMGRFIPAIPIHASELGERGIWFDYDRLCTPLINDDILQRYFGEQAPFVKSQFLQPGEKEGYTLLPEFDTQKKVEAHFTNRDNSDGAVIIKQGLFDLISNVVLFEEEGSNRQQFHFRIAVEETTSFQYLDEITRHKLKDLYVHYFYRRQDTFWKGEALKKLPALKDATSMLICGEDLGMVPHSVPEVMQQLGILSLEIQRMPKNPQTEFFHPKDAPYLSVVTPSSHDMSTIRGWWEEDREKTQRFFNYLLGEGGEAPYFCEPWVNRAIVLQHLYSPAMWAIFQLQDLMGMSETLRRKNPEEERINQPANPTHYWNYRMHLPLEQLIREQSFNEELADYIKNSGRS